MTIRRRAPVTFVVGYRPGGTGDAPHTPLHAPPLDVVETDRGFRVVLEIPGSDPSRLSVEVHGRTLTIRGERLPTPGEEGRFLRVERAVGPFERSLELPDALDPERAEAAYQDGILTVELARREARRRRIEIGRNAS